VEHVEDEPPYGLQVNWEHPPVGYGSVISHRNVDADVNVDLITRRDPHDIIPQPARSDR
jgi:hypothetical protein